MSEELLGLLNALATHPEAVVRHTVINAKDRITALIAAGDKLNELACHQDDCEIVTHGVWSDPIPCTCGYTEAWKAWTEARGDDV